MFFFFKETIKFDILYTKLKRENIVLDKEKNPGLHIFMSQF